MSVPRDWTNVWAWPPPDGYRSLKEWWENSERLIDLERRRRIQMVPTARLSLALQANPKGRER